MTRTRRALAILITWLLCAASITLTPAQTTAGIYSAELTTNAESELLHHLAGNVTLLSTGAKHTYTLSPASSAALLINPLSTTKLTLDNIDLQAMGDVTLLSDSISGAEILIHNGANLTQTNTTDDFRVGDDTRRGRLIVKDTGTSLTASRVTLAESGASAQSGSSSIFIYDSAQATMQSLKVYDGSMQVYGGASLDVLSNLSFTIGGNDPDDRAFFSLNNAGTTLTANGAITVGGSTTTSGDAWFSIRDNATANIKYITVNQTGTASVTTGATLTTNPSLLIRVQGGQFIIDGGTVNDNSTLGPRLSDSGQATIDNAGTFNTIEPIEIQDATLHLADGTISTPDIVFDDVNADFQFDTGTLHFTTDKTITPGNAHKLNIATLTAGKNLQVTGTLTHETNLNVNGGNINATTLLIGEDDAVTTTVDSGAAL